MDRYLKVAWAILIIGLFAFIEIQNRRIDHFEEKNKALATQVVAVNVEMRKCEERANRINASLVECIDSYQECRSDYPAETLSADEFVDGYPAMTK
jgi:hypothetical protein